MKAINKMIQVEMKEEMVGPVKSDSVMEYGKIIDVASDCKKFSITDIGKTLYFKAWAINIIAIDEKKYYFISEDSEAICAMGM